LDKYSTDYTCSPIVVNRLNEVSQFNKPNLMLPCVN